MNKHCNTWQINQITSLLTVCPKKYAHGFCFAVLCCCYTLTDFPISIRLTSLALWQSNDCPSASKATLMNMDKYFMWIHYERLHNHNKAKHNKPCAYFLGFTVSFISISALMIIGLYCGLAYHPNTLWKSKILLWSFCYRESHNHTFASASLSTVYG